MRAAGLIVTDGFRVLPIDDDGDVVRSFAVPR